MDPISVKNWVPNQGGLVITAHLCLYQETLIQGPSKEWSSVQPSTPASPCLDRKNRSIRKPPSTRQTKPPFFEGFLASQISAPQEGAELLVIFFPAQISNHNSRKVPSLGGINSERGSVLSPTARVTRGFCGLELGFKELLIERFPTRWAQSHQFFQ